MLYFIRKKKKKKTFNRFSKTTAYIRYDFILTETLCDPNTDHIQFQ